ncbi:MAG: hypothetical protein ABIO67_06295 [Mycobacteriales bacterium]
MRTVVRSTLLAGLTGSLMVSAAWAGIGFAPVPTSSTPIEVPGTAATSAAAAGAESTGTPVNPVTLGAGQLLVGAAKTSMNPRPEDFPGAVWERDPAKCQTLAPAWFQDLPTAAVNALDGIANPGSVWPENPNCIYQGGFGLGPMNPVKAFDQEFGLWVRSMAFSDGKQTLVTTVIDGEGWLLDYKSKCTDCGAKQIAAALAADPELAARGVTAASHVLHATHSHASPDFIGGWGFVPNWYMKQITDTIKATAKQAVMQMEAATLETGEAEARAQNSERRGTYHSPEESSISWLRAVAVAQPAADPAPTATATTSPGPGASDAAPGQVKKQPTPSPSATETAAPPATPRVIATLGAYAAHPVTYGNNGGVAHPDWPGLFNQSLENRFGGIGLHFQTGLGNMTGANRLTGKALVDLLPAVGAGRPVRDTTVKVDQVLTRSALTNVPLSALGTPGLFDRKFDPQPVAVAVSDSDADAADQESLQRDGASVQKGQAPETAPCISASAQSVELPATAARIGNDIIFTAAPGEVFANYTNTVKEKNAGRISFPLAQANDALGYMPQSFEINQVGQQGLGFAAGGFLFINYEDSYAIDKCTGDLLMEKTLDLLKTVKAP